MPKKLVYVAGPYRSKGGMNGVFENIMLARKYARQVWLRGDVAICPHLNTMLMDDPEVPDETWLNGDLEILVRCDVIAMIPGWENSTGAIAELECAKANGLAVEFLGVDDHEVGW